MKLDIKIVSVHGVPANRSGLREFPEGTCVVDLIGLLRLPHEDTYAVMVNDRPVPPDERRRHILAEADRVTIFPPIHGG